MLRELFTNGLASFLAALFFGLPPEPYDNGPGMDPDGDRGPGMDPNG